MNLGANSGGRGVWEFEAQPAARYSPVTLYRFRESIASDIPYTNRCAPILPEIGLQHETAQGSAGGTRSGPGDPSHHAQSIAGQEIGKLRRPTGSFGAGAR